MELDYNVSSGPLLSFEIEVGDGPGPELDNCWLQVICKKKREHILDNHDAVQL